MRQRRVTITRSTPAPLEQVWELLSRTASWPAWAPIRTASLEREGAGAPDGVGAVRSFRTAFGTTREEIVAFEAPRHVAYVLLSGLPVEDYRSDVHLAPAADGGTTITWSSTFRSSWLWHRVVDVAIRRFSRRLAAGAARLRSAIS